MRLFFRYIFVLLIGFSIVSCLGDNDDEIVYYDDAAIIAASLGQLNQYLPTKTYDGLDSIAKSTVSGNNYHLVIDQIKHEIFNVDSLPYGTDITKVVTTLVAKNSGTIYIHNVAGDSVKIHSATDSIDFSTPRKFTVFSNSGRNYQEYTMTVNVHKQQADEFVWQHSAVGTLFSQCVAMSAVEMGGRMYVVGSDGISSMIASAPLDAPEQWTVATPDVNTPLPADMPKSIAVKDNRLYTIINQHLMTTADGNQWIDEGQALVSKIIGSDDIFIYGVDENGAIYSSSDNGSTWQKDDLDDNIQLLPTADISLVKQALPTNRDMYRVVLMGNRSIDTYPNDAYATVWSRIIDTTGATTYPWMYYNQSSKALYQAPRLNNLTMMDYNGRLIAIGGMPLGMCTIPAFSAIYESLDNGLTWKESTLLTLPSAFVSVANVFCAAVDSEKFIWLINAHTGEIWRARLSQLGWETPQTIFQTKGK